MSIKKEFKKSLFIFRRDLRLHDNTGLIHALHRSETIIPCFIFDPRQIGQANAYKSNNAIQFMIESLVDLNKQLFKKHGQLYLFYGIAEKVVSKIIAQEKIDAVFCNRDYTPFSAMRDQNIQDICIQHHCAYITSYDALINEPEIIHKNNGTPYSMFTPFYKKSLTYAVKPPTALPRASLYSRAISLECNHAHIFKKILPQFNAHINDHGGSNNAHKLIKKISYQKKYAQTHDIPSFATSHLSAHLKFGTISVRHVYDVIKTQLGAQHPLIRQLYWRDFFTHIAYHWPYVFGHSFNRKYDALVWSTDKQHLKAWCQGTTGVPIVDAGMRELITTGFMHNRVRMITASFLVKDLHIDWRIGEKFFARYLVDYDPAVNNGNWQWIASTGADHQPYFRIFNPWIQQKKFDPDCVYIKQWIPELKNTPLKTIHAWVKQKKSSDYPLPCVDHNKQATYARTSYSKIKG